MHRSRQGSRSDGSRRSDADPRGGYAVKQINWHLSKYRFEKQVKNVGQNSIEKQEEICYEDEKNASLLLSRYITLLIALMLVLTGCSKAVSLTPVGSQSDENVTVGIAWRADTDSEFFTNIAATLEHMNINYVMLPQVICDEIPYENGLAASVCIAPNDYLEQEYADIVKTTEYKNTNLDEVTDNIDGVIFTGGEDVSPTLYKEPQEWHGIEEERDYNATRDVKDYLLMRYCIDNDIPAIGFCRGMQMLGIVSGATVIQDIPVYYAEQETEYDFIHRNNKKTPESYRDYAPHDVTVIEKDSLLYQIVGKTTLDDVPSWHHQALLNVDNCNLKVTGVTNTGGIDMIEAIERSDKAFIVGMQFHPEAAIVKHMNNTANAGDYMSEETAREFFEYFLQVLQKQ